MQLFLNALIAGSFAALLASGLSLVYGVLGIFNMALGQLALVGGLTTWWLASVLSWPLAFAIAGGIGVTALVTWLEFEFFVAEYYQRQRFLPLVTTIAFSMIIDGLVLMLFHEDPKTIDVGARHLVPVVGALISSQQILLIVLTILFLAILTWILVATPFGRRIRATVQHPRAAESLGIRSSLLHRILFIVSGVLAGFSGIYLCIDQNLTPTIGFSITIKAYAALIAGGKDSLKGAILCAYLIALLEQLAVGLPWFGVYIPSGYQSTVALFVIIVILLFKPEGIFGKKIRIA